MEKRCEECPAVHCNPDGWCAPCQLAGATKADGTRLPGLVEKFPVDFRIWVGELMRVFTWSQVGYPIGELELGYEDWQALVVIKAWLQMKAREESQSE